MRRLVIVDSLTADWLPAAQALEGGGEWDVLVLRHGADFFRDAFSRELMRYLRLINSHHPQTMPSDSTYLSLLPPCLIST